MDDEPQRMQQFDIATPTPLQQTVDQLMAQLQRLDVQQHKHEEQTKAHGDKIQTSLDTMNALVYDVSIKIHNFESAAGTPASHSIA